MGLQVDVENGNGACINSLPAEVYLCGVIQKGAGNYDEQAVKNRLSEVYVTDNPVFICYQSDTKFAASFYINGRLENTKFDPISEQEILSQFLYLRLKANVPLTCELVTNSIKESFTNLRKIIASGVMTFSFNKNNVYLLGNDSDGVVGVAGNPTIGELTDETNEQSEGGRKKKVHNYEIDVMEVNMLKRTTGENGTVGVHEHAPLCVLDKSKLKIFVLATL